MNHQTNDISLSEVHNSVDTTGKKSKFRRILSFFGPAYLISVGYMDPGNWATDLAGGSKFNYSLLWVLLMSNIMALLLQSLAARLGIVRGRDLAQANRELYPKKINLVLYLLAEVAIAATDLAEVLGMAIGINLLTGVPLMWGVLITVLDTFLLLVLQRLGMRKMEAFIIALVAVIGFSFLIEIIFANPPMGEVVTGLVPSIPNSEALYIAIGIIGATVMPHNLYLHSALVQTRKIKSDPAGIKHALKMNFFDSAIALNLAFFVNAAILVLAASVFYKAGRTDVAEIRDAHTLLAPLLGNKLAPFLFAIALIAAGQSSTITGTLAGQIVMEGYLRLRINPWLRRLLTRLLAIGPAIFVILLYGDQEVDALLILSQVVLSLQLGFAIIPLIHFVSDKEKMEGFAIGPVVKILAWVVAAVLVVLNMKMVIGEIVGVIEGDQNIFVKILVSVGGLTLAGLLLLVTFYPWLQKKKLSAQVAIHPETKSISQGSVPSFHRVAVALDFSEFDDKLILHAIGQGSTGCEYVLIHVVESVSARIHGSASDDFEARKDLEKLNDYVSQLNALGYQAKGMLGYRNRKEEIVRIVKEQAAEILVMGGHGHAGVSDWLYGETINQVRHEVKIPVLIVTR